MIIQILCDTPHSWIIPYAKTIRNRLIDLGYEASLVHVHSEIKKGDILILLSCEKLLKQLQLNTHNLVVHESALPEGKGWSPITWQILEGKKSIPITLFEAADKVDSGVIYGQKNIVLNGTELIEEIRTKQAEATSSLIFDFVKSYPLITGRAQNGEETFYKKRRPQDSKLDVSKTIEEQFDLLRVCDNEKYPAFFELLGEQYIIKIYKK